MVNYVGLISRARSYIPIGPVFITDYDQIRELRLRFGGYRLELNGVVLTKMLGDRNF